LGTSIPRKSVRVAKRVKHKCIAVAAKAFIFKFILRNNFSALPISLALLSGLIIKGN
jgi:hypothetical protein